MEVKGSRWVAQQEICARLWAIGLCSLSSVRSLTYLNHQSFVVYGHNASSGKSGYVRLMKEAPCGKSDAFGTSHKSLCWATSDTRLPHWIQGKRHRYGLWLECCKGCGDTELAGIDIFDADTSWLYVSREKEASYTPPILVLFDGLVKVNLLVRQLFQSERDSLVSKFPSIPANLRMTTVATKLQTLKASDVESLEVLLSWTDDDESELRRLEQRLWQKIRLVCPRNSEIKLDKSKIFCSKSMPQYQHYLKKLAWSSLCLGPKHLINVISPEREWIKRSIQFH